MIQTNTAEFVVRFANGSRRKQVAGIVHLRVRPNFILAVAERRGTLSIRAENVRVAIINGIGRRVYPVIKIRLTKIGIYKTERELQFAGKVISRFNHFKLYI